LPENNERLRRKEEVRNAWNDGRSTRNQNFALRNKGKKMTEEPEERCKNKKERPAPGLTKFDRTSQGYVFKKVQWVLNHHTEFCQTYIHRT